MSTAPGDAAEGAGSPDGPDEDATGGGWLPDGREYAAVVAAGLVGAAAVVPYQSALVKLPEAGWQDLLVQNLVVVGLSVAVAAFVGLVLARRVGLTALPDAERVRSTPREYARAYGLAAGLGALAAVAVVALDALVFGPLVEDAVVDSPVGVTDAGLPARLLAGLYGGITEEILLRLGFVTLLLWAGWRAWGLVTEVDPDEPSPAAAWGAVFAAAVFFALGHIPATAAAFELTPAVMARALVLNGLGGVVFGWLYWRRDLVAAMAAHFAADVVLLVVAPLLVAAA